MTREVVEDNNFHHRDDDRRAGNCHLLLRCWNRVQYSVKNSVMSEREVEKEEEELEVEMAE